MTTLATHPVGDPDQLCLIADDLTPLGKPFADKFRDACEVEANAHGDWVDPNAVRLRLLDEHDYNPQRYAALWCAADGPNGFLDKTEVPVQIAGEGSRGNSNKSTFYRKWRRGA